MDPVQSEIRALLDSQFAAIRDKDIERLMSAYSADVVYFDVVPPLQYAGSAALRARFLHWFDGYQGAIDMEVSDVSVLANGDIAVVHLFSRAKGVLKNGRKVGVWVRVTSCCQRSDHGWLIIHEHVSIPVDVSTASPAMELAP
jgi:uncharacterized protein (TIGR02246 family)